MKILKSLPFRLLVGVVLGIVVGLLIPRYHQALGGPRPPSPSAILQIIVTVKYILNQLISFCVPLIIIGFIAPSIVKLGSKRLPDAGAWRCCWLTCPPWARPCSPWAPASPSSPV